MALATWWRGDERLTLKPLLGFHVLAASDDEELAGINHISPAELRARRADGHRPYAAYISGEPVAYGWVATREAAIGELRLRFALDERNRYLWDFATLPKWQGHGIYPHLLQAIVTRELQAAERFWIIYAPENLPSGAGVDKAGFSPVGHLSFTAAGTVGLAPYRAHPRAADGAALLGVPLIETLLAPCWQCGGATVKQADDAELCWPPLSPATPACSCATPRKSSPRLNA